MESKAVVTADNAIYVLEIVRNVCVSHCEASFLGGTHPATEKCHYTLYYLCADGLTSNIP